MPGGSLSTVDQGNVVTQIDPCDAMLQYIDDDQDIYNPPALIPYDKDPKNKVLIGSGWTSFFTNSNSGKCPITGCQLLQADDTDCGQPYKNDARIQIDTKKPY